MKAFLTVPELSDFIGEHRHTTQAALRRGDYKPCIGGGRKPYKVSLKVAARVLGVDVADLQTWLAQREQAAARK